MLCSPQVEGALTAEPSDQTDKPCQGLARWATQNQVPSGLVSPLLGPAQDPCLLHVPTHTSTQETVPAGWPVAPPTSCRPVLSSEQAFGVPHLPPLPSKALGSLPPGGQVQPPPTGLSVANAVFAVDRAG